MCDKELDERECSCDCGFQMPEHGFVRDENEIE